MWLCKNKEKLNRPLICIRKIFLIIKQTTWVPISILKRLLKRNFQPFQNLHPTSSPIQSPPINYAFKLLNYEGCLPTAATATLSDITEGFPYYTKENTPFIRTRKIRSIVRGHTERVTKKKGGEWASSLLRTRAANRQCGNPRRLFLGWFTTGCGYKKSFVI